MTEFFKRKSALLFLLVIVSVAVVLSSSYVLRSDAAPAQDGWSKPAQKAPQKKAASPDAKSPASLRPVAAHSETKVGQKAALREVKILPSDIPLTGPRASQRLVVEALFDDGHQEDVTAQAKVSSSNPRVAALDLGFVKPA